MGIASHLSWAHFLTVQATLFPNLVLFLLLLLCSILLLHAVTHQCNSGGVSLFWTKCLLDQPHHRHSAIIEMQPGQKVSDSLLFYVA